MSASRSSTGRDLDKAAARGEPSYVWRAGQERRLKMVLDSAGERVNGRILENGCGVGMYVDHLAPTCGQIVGLEYEFERAQQANIATSNHGNAQIIGAAGERLPFEDNVFDVILSHEVLEHVQDDRFAVHEMVRTLRPGGCMVVFVPNRGYPFETHGIFLKDKYRFGNIPLVNYLPRRFRDRLAPHVRVYTSKDLELLFSDLPVQFQTQTIIFGAYDNIINRWPTIGKILRSFLFAIEKTPLRWAGLSHYWVVEKL